MPSAGQKPDSDRVPKGAGLAPATARPTGVMRQSGLPATSVVRSRARVCYRGASAWAAACWKARRTSLASLLGKLERWTIST
ncbi:MAG: hypothetical protein RJB04_173 [Verrucomicrobiota bacterium]